MSRVADVTTSKSAKCHPARRMARFRDGACLECVVEEHRAKERQKHPEKPQAHVDLTPRRIPGVRQLTLTEIPPSCPKCHKKLLAVEGRRVACPGVLGGCGADFYLVSR
jgi:hypothetical protein